MDEAEQIQAWRSVALQALQSAQPDEKLALTKMLQEATRSTGILRDVPALPLREPPGLPGRPPRPQLLAHLDLPQISLHAPRGLAALLHSVCHIEFNAINLALDAVWRFDGMPAAYYKDWIRVAAEEAHHFQLLRRLLQSLGADYGDFPAHTGLWDMAFRTKDDITARMALVPRTLEARGLDATPPMQAKLRKLGTAAAWEAVAVLDVILRDEIGHVAVGNRWYRWLCERNGHDPVALFRSLCEQHAAPRPRAPINHEARRLAGFSDAEITALLSNQ